MARKKAQESASFDELTAQQWQAVWLLVAGSRQVDVATHVGVTQETVSRWKALPQFQAALNTAICDTYAANIGEIRSTARDAIEVLRSCLQSGDERIRLSAAVQLIGLHLKLDRDAVQLPQTADEVDVAQRRKETELLYSKLQL